MDRDFKGVWIPKEIWLTKELTLIEKVIFTEISSLDNEHHCTASNEYFAEFCDCSVSKVSKAIKKLKDLSMIEELDFDGRHRTLCVIKNDSQTSKKYYAAEHFLPANNIISNLDNSNSKTNSKELVEDCKSSDNFSFGSKKPSSSNLYTKCISLIDNYTTNSELRSALIEYLKLRLEMKDVPLYANSWKGLLNKLNRDFGTSERLAVVRQSIERGYKSFFPLNNHNVKIHNVEHDVKSVAYTEEELKELQKLDEERERNGLRTKF